MSYSIHSIMRCNKSLLRLQYSLSYKSNTFIPKIKPSIGQYSLQGEHSHLRSCLHLLIKYTEGIIAMAATITNLIRASTALQLLFISATMWLTTAAPINPRRLNGTIALEQFKDGMVVLQRIHVSKFVSACYLLLYIYTL